MMMRRLMYLLDGFFDRLTDALYGPGPYVALRWKVVSLALLATAIALGWLAMP
jgi:hypothetical protein